MADFGINRVVPYNSGTESSPVYAHRVVHLPTPPRSLDEYVDDSDAELPDREPRGVWQKIAHPDGRNAGQWDRNGWGDPRLKSEQVWQYYVEGRDDLTFVLARNQLPGQGALALQAAAENPLVEEEGDWD
jgi:hypothetical protein